MSTNVTVRCHRTNTKRQVAKGTRWMPRHREAKKDAATGETPRGAGSMLRSVDVRMGKPNGSHVPLLRKESKPREVKHLSTWRKRNQTRFP